MTHGQTLRAYLDWCDWADLRAGDRYLIVEPVLPHLRLQGRLPRVPHARRDDLPARGVRRRASCSRSSSASGSRCCPGRRRSTSRCSTIPTARARDISSLRVAVTGAADIPVELIRRVREELPFERILTGYGLTEAGTVTGSQPDDDFEHIATTVGVPWPGFEVRTVDRVGRRRRAGRAGRGRRARRDRDARLPRRPGGDRGRDRRRRLAAHRRPRHDRRRRLPAHRRAHQGHVHRRRVQRVPGRDREPACCGTRASRRSR